MLNSKVKIVEVFNLSSRDLLVLTGELISGDIYDNMDLVIEEKQIRVKVNSIEAVSSKNASVAITFCIDEHLDVNKFNSLCKGDVVTLNKSN